MKNFFQLSVEMQQQIDWINQVLIGSEYETVNIHGVVKPTVQKAIKDNFSAVKAMVIGRLPFETHAQLIAAGDPGDVVLAEVWNDGDRDKNGLYGWTGLAWIKSPYDSTALLQADLNKTQQQAESGYRAAIQNVSENGLTGNIHQALDVLIQAGLHSDDEIVGATTDDHGNMLEAYNQKGEKILATIVRFLRDLKMNNTTLTDGTYNYAAAVADDNGNVAFGVDEHGKTLAAFLHVLGGVEVGDSALESGEYNYDFALIDENGYVGFGFMNGRLYSADVDVVDSISIRDNKNVTKSNQVKSQINTLPCQNIFDYNHLIVYGQSLSTGMEGWPRLSKQPMFGNLMLGDCVRPKSISGASFVPLGDAIELKPLVSCVQNSGSGVIISDDNVANLRPGDGASGETPTEGWVNMSKFLHNRHNGLLNDERTFIGTNNGVPGRTIEQLSKGASPELYTRFTQCIEQVKGLALAENKTYGVTGICWLQGEYNYISNHGGDTSRLGYLDKLKKLRLDMLSDIQRVTLQTQDPAFFTYQVGAAYSRDDNELSIGMAQWDFARDIDNAYLVAPVYPYTDKGGHLDSNGYRWYGNMIAKVYHKVVTLGQNWKPLSPTKIELDGQTITINFHVPEPPLKFALPYIANTATDYASKGFRVTDSGQNIAINSVEIVGQTIIKVTLASVVSQSAKIWYADKTQHNGNGNVCDTDEIVAFDRYEYDPLSGQYPTVNQPHLNNKPYPLNNWLIAFCLPVNWSE